MVTNDPKNEQINLQVSGNVKRFATITPSKVLLRGNVGEPLSQTVSIIPGENEAFKILQANSLKGGDFKFRLEEKEIEGKKAYSLTVENTRKTEGRYFDKIFMITDRTDQEPLSIIVSGNLTSPQDMKAKENNGGPAPETTPGPAPESAPLTAPAPPAN